MVNGLCYRELGHRLRSRAEDGRDRLWHDSYGAELVKMPVECEGVRKFKLLDHDLAGAVGDIPLLVVVSAENLPGSPDVIFS